jgi:hypothetical protein
MMSSVLYVTYIVFVEILSQFFGVSCKLCVILSYYDKNKIQATDFSDDNKLRSPSSSYGDERFGQTAR